MRRDLSRGFSAKEYKLINLLSYTIAFGERRENAECYFDTLRNKHIEYFEKKFAHICESLLKIMDFYDIIQIIMSDSVSNHRYLCFSGRRIMYGFIL